MKFYVIRETSGYPFITRHGQLVQIGIGQQFTEEELPTLQCTAPTTYMSLDDNTIHTLGELAVTAVVKPIVIEPVIEPVAEPVVEPVVEEAPVEGVVPSSVETGSETSEA